METNKPKAGTEQSQSAEEWLDDYLNDLGHNEKHFLANKANVLLMIEQFAEHCSSSQCETQNVSAEEWINANKELLQKEAKKLAKKKSGNYYWRYTANDFIDVMILAIYQFASSQTKISEEDAERDFKDWLGWNNQLPPDKDDPDYYTYSWGMNVWVNAMRAYKLLKSK